ncbi:MAG: hypothetical protein ACRDLZ_09330 [Gaiellaceae bacterium]
MTRTFRDEELGAALRELEAPEHRPEFHAELRRLLAQEQVTRLIALAVVAYDVFRAEPGEALVVGVGVPTAAEVQRQVREALGAAEGLGGILVWDDSEPGDEQRWRFLLSAQGDLRLSGLTHTEEIAYDARRAAERIYIRDEDGTISAAVRRGLAPGWPDPAPSDWLLPGEFGALVRTFLAARDPSLRETTYDGRPAWRLEVEAIPSGIAPELTGDRFAITVDRGTGMPVEVTETFRDEFRRHIRIEKLAVDPPVDRDSFTLEFPPEAKPNDLEHGFQRVELDQVGQIVGYDPLVPAWLPEGFRPAEVAVHPGMGSPTGVEASNPPSTDVVSLSYRRGLDQVLVTTRSRDVAGWPDSWTDPLATGEGYRDRPERLALGRGALSGVEAKLLLVPRNVPHLWALGDELVVTVSGDLSRAELVRVAESLEARP